MRVRDFAAELISEIADELGYLVYKYECSMPSCGSIVFEKEIEGNEEEEATLRRYKILNYNGHTVHLQQLAGLEIVDLHDPDSVEDLREWFEDLEDAFDSPFGYGSFTGPVGIQGPAGTTPPTPIPPYTITVSPHTQPVQPAVWVDATWVGSETGEVGWNPNIGSWTGTAPPTSQLTISNHQQSSNHLFSFNSFGSLSLGP